MNEFFYSPHEKQLQQQKHVRAEATFLLQPDHSASLRLSLSSR